MRFLFVFALVLSACTPAEVQEWWFDAGQVVPLSDEVAVAIADVVATDCLPGYTSPREVECSIVDSWNAYPNMPVSLEVWSRVAWCESGHRADAKNPSSSASGLFQQLARYWPGRAEAAGMAGGDIFDARTNAFVSAHLASTSGIQHWNPSAHCWK